MKHDHNHSCSCEHNNIRYCKHCDTAYCGGCNREWHSSYSYGYRYYPYYPYVGGTAGGVTHTNMNYDLANQTTTCQHGL